MVGNNQVSLRSYISPLCLKGGLPTPDLSKISAINSRPIYRVYKKKLNRFEIALSFGKQLLVSSFFMYIASLGTYKVE
jgi:hypothetical protein